MLKIETEPEETELDEPETASTTTSSPSKLFWLVKEPLLHFVLAGAVIYLLFGKALYTGDIDLTEALEIVSEQRQI